MYRYNYCIYIHIKYHIIIYIYHPNRPNCPPSVGYFHRLQKLHSWWFNHVKPCQTSNFLVQKMVASYCGWLRNPAPPNGLLKHAETIWNPFRIFITSLNQVDAGFRNHSLCQVIWLVVYLPLWKIWVRQLWWWHSQYTESQNSCSKPPTKLV